MTVNVHGSGDGTPVEVTVFGSDGGKIASGTGTSGEEFKFTVDNVKPWWPESPTLYNLTVTLGGDDEVFSYTGFRTISKGDVNGVPRQLLNGEFVFWFGTLDQGYWPDGLHTPPNAEAMEYDIKVLKDYGFNMLRKHVSNSALFIPYLAPRGLALCKPSARIQLLTWFPHCRSRLSPICSTTPATDLDSW